MPAEASGPTLPGVPEVFLATEGFVSGEPKDVGQPMNPYEPSPRTDALHTDSIDAAESHAALLVHLGRLPEALQIVRKLHGDAHVWTISLLDKLVRRGLSDGQSAAAEPYAAELVDATERALGADNDATLRSRLLLAAVQSKKTAEVKPYGAITYKSRIY